MWFHLEKVMSPRFAHMHKVVLLHFKLSSTQTLVNVACKICYNGLITKEITKRNVLVLKAGGWCPSIYSSEIKKIFGPPKHCWLLCTINQSLIIFYSFDELLFAGSSTVRYFFVAINLICLLFVT